MSKSVLIVEDDANIADLLRLYLEKEGYRVVMAGSLGGGRVLYRQEKPDAVLLDLNLPDGDGMSFCREIRKNSQVPILMVTARDMETDEVMGLETGADDYLTKPFSATELTARIRVAFRHLYREGMVRMKSSYQVGSLVLDLEKRQVTLRGQPLHLTPMEYNLLSLFLRNSGKVLTTRYLISEIWGSGYGEDTQALRALMAGLRRKIEENPAKPRYIVTEIGVGYRLVEQEIQKGPY